MKTSRRCSRSAAKMRILFNSCSVTLKLCKNPSLRTLTTCSTLVRSLTYSHQMRRSIFVTNFLIELAQSDKETTVIRSTPTSLPSAENVCISCLHSRLSVSSSETGAVSSHQSLTAVQSIGTTPGPQKLSSLWLSVSTTRTKQNLALLVNKRSSLMHLSLSMSQ